VVIFFAKIISVGLIVEVRTGVDEVLIIVGKGDSIGDKDEDGEDDKVSIGVGDRLTTEDGVISMVGEGDNVTVALIVGFGSGILVGLKDA